MPGPSEYSSTTKKEFGKEGRLFSFGKEDRFCDKRPLTPGPGNFDNIKSKEITSIKSNFGNNFNNTIYRFNNNPGPGSYNANDPKNKPKAPAHR